MSYAESDQEHNVFMTIGPSTFNFVYTDGSRSLQTFTLQLLTQTRWGLNL